MSLRSIHYRLRDVNYLSFSDHYFAYHHQYFDYLLYLHSSVAAAEIDGADSSFVAVDFVEFRCVEAAAVVIDLSAVLSVAGDLMK